MIGALIDGAYSKPKKKKAILRVMPKNDNKISLSQSSLSIRKFRKLKGRRISIATKNLKKARVNGGIFCKAILNIGEAAPQIILAIMRARIAC